MSPIHVSSVALPARAKDVFDWHTRAGALERMLPPWERVDVRARTGGLARGSLVELTTRIGPFPSRWIAEHVEVVPGKRFRDVQRAGPFARFDHEHTFEPKGGDTCLLKDRVDYALPLGALGALVAGRFVQRKLDRMFRYRHSVLARDLARHGKAKRIMKVLVTGSTGLLGSALVPFLTSGGHSVARLVRGAPKGPDEIAWDPERGALDGARLEGFDAVVHLAGENIAGRRWSAAQKARILASRVVGTKTLCAALAKLARKPTVLVSASAVGIYGDRKDEEIDESSLPGSGFLSQVCRAWESATLEAQEARIRTVNLRFGVVLSPRGGALAKMLLPFKLGLGGPVGDGEQYLSWIAIDDAVGAIHHALTTESLEGPVNAVAPHPVTSREFAQALGTVLHRPAFLPLPASAARLVFGELADELLLAGQRVRPRALQRTNYDFAEPELESALRHVLGK